MRKKVVQNFSAQRFIAKKTMYHNAGEKLKNSSSDAAFYNNGEKKKKESSRLCTMTLDSTEKGLY